MSNASLTARWSSWAPYLLSTLRIIAAFLFIQYGTTKLLAFPAPIMPDGGTAPLTSLAGVAGALELVGGALLLVGLFTRPWLFCSQARWRWPISSATRPRDSGRF